MSLSNGNIVLTGASGFLGRFVVEELRRRNVNFIPLVMEQDSGIEGARVIDLNDQKAVSEFMLETKPSHCLHLAWYTAHGVYWKSPINIECMNFSLKLFESFVKAGGTRFLGVGTCAEYDWTQPGPYDESSAVDPATLYGRAKLSTFQMMQKLAENHNGVSLGWARPFYPYGPGEPDGKLIKDLIASVKSGAEMTLRPDQTDRDFIHIEDVASALCHALLSEIEGVVNVSSGQGYKTTDVMNIIAKVAGAEGQWKLDESNMNSKANQLVGINSKLTESGWSPKYDLLSGIKSYFELS